MRQHPADIIAPRIMRGVLLAGTVAFMGVFLVAPLCAICAGACAHGIGPMLATFRDPACRSAAWLTLLTAAVVVPVNMGFGLAAAWCLGKFSFPGRRLLIAMLDLPFTVSPVIAGLLFVLLFGRNSLLGSFLEAHQVQVIFAVPGIIITSLFVTMPYVAKELLPHMEAHGTEQELAARLLGASGVQTFLRVTLPRIKWGLLYGVILCNARAMGEFGAVSVVSGHIRGETNTLPLHVEILYNEYNAVGAFSAALLLAVLALATLAAKEYIELRTGRKEWVSPGRVPCP